MTQENIKLTIAQQNELIHSRASDALITQIGALEATERTSYLRKVRSNWIKAFGRRAGLRMFKAFQRKLSAYIKTVLQAE